MWHSRRVFDCLVSALKASVRTGTREKMREKMSKENKQDFVIRGGTHTQQKLSIVGNSDTAKSKPLVNK